MTSVHVTNYVGRFDGPGHSDLTTAGELAETIRRSDVVRIDDPLSFPWEWFADAPIRCPVILDVRTCVEDDLIALLPALSVLTASDRIMGDHARVIVLCAALGLPDIWADPDLDVRRFAREFGRSKRADVEEASIIHRLSQDEQLIIRTIEGETLRSSRDGFAALVKQLSEEHDDATVDTIWGIHPDPGTPLERAVVALRPRTAT